MQGSFLPVYMIHGGALGYANVYAKGSLALLVIIKEGKALGMMGFESP